jgi:hypothetical protein
MSSTFTQSPFLESLNTAAHHLFFQFLKLGFDGCFTITFGETSLVIYLPSAVMTGLPWNNPLDENRLLNSWHRHMEFTPHILKIVY